MAELTTEQAKKYSRIDTDDDDDFINSLIIFSEEYLKGAGIDFIDNETYKLAQKIIIDDRYNHRGSKDVTPKAQSSLNCIILQLQNIDEVII